MESAIEKSKVTATEDSPNVESATEESEVTATTDPTTKDPLSALQPETTIQLDNHNSSQSECINPLKTSFQLTTNAETDIKALKTPTLRMYYSRRKMNVTDSHAPIINLESGNDNNASILIPNSFPQDDVDLPIALRKGVRSCNYVLFCVFAEPFALI